MTTSFSLRTLSRADILENLSPLSDILADCVNGGASVSFMLPFSLQTARTFWLRIAESVAGRGAPRAGGRTCRADCRHGTAGHRSTGKSASSRRRGKTFGSPKCAAAGLANALMNYLEQLAREQGKSVLVLDTATGSGAERFYVQCGWEKAGEIPRYALMPDGTMTATSLFYKILQ